MEEVKNSVSQEQVHDLIFSRELGWQEIIYDLIHTEQLDPWDINLSILSEKYLKKVIEMEEADFFVSSKVLHAASLLLRIKSEILLNKYIQSIDDILFGQKEEKKKYELERIELDDEIPELVMRTPIPRFKKVTLKELMGALDKAIQTENRRIKKEIIKSNAVRLTNFSMPKKKINIKDRIKNIYSRLTDHFTNTQDKKISFSLFAGETREQKVDHFFPLLQLENNKKIWLEQENHFDEIHIWLRKVYIEHNGDPFVDLKERLEQDGIELSPEDERKLEIIEELMDSEVD